MFLDFELETAPGFGMRVNEDDSIAKVKLMIWNNDGIRASHQRLFYKGTELQDDQTVDECGLQSHSMLQLQRRVEILVKTFGGRIVPMDVEGSDTIDNVLAKSQVEVGFGEDLQIVVEAGRWQRFRFLDGNGEVWTEKTKQALASGELAEWVLQHEKRRRNQHDDNIL